MNIIERFNPIRRLRIGLRLMVLIAAQILILMIIGVAAITGLQFAASTTGELNETVSEQVQLNRIATVVQGGLLGTANDVYRGTITWGEANRRLAESQQAFDQRWAEYVEQTGRRDEAATAPLQQGMNGVHAAFAELTKLIAREDRANLSLYVLNDLDASVAPFLTRLESRIAAGQQASQEQFAASTAANAAFLYGALALVLIGGLFAALLGWVIYRSIVNPIRDIADTVERISEGDYSARTDVVSHDELGDLAQAFNRLLDERVNALVKAERESERLNNSVIGLIKAVSQLAQQRDLTVRAPVSEDITGAIGDSLNLLANETANILLGVREISHQVAQVSQQVKSQSDTVIEVARQEYDEVLTTADLLRQSVNAMAHIAEDARLANERADRASKNTDEAAESVIKSVQGINSIRETISETEKRIKRLGERSQEITGIVNLIGSIAERTHILALNASMHAASAGEAGRGFAVVADEVQRLAENAREATAQISTLVNNIRVETADTVQTMNLAITQVAEGTRLAERAGDSMRQTRAATEELVSSVQQIATSSDAQASASRALLERARQIQSSTEKTGKELQAQTQSTEALVRFADRLVQAIGVFRLPQPRTEKFGDTQQIESMDEARRVG
ncbi:MAG: HAMP domain-containing protein [Chromatiales bacterium]|nr:HAMP domain-containing protein [Chromatiales bacterium]